jgi:hypothetical protein
MRLPQGLLQDEMRNSWPRLRRITEPRQFSVALEANGGTLMIRLDCVVMVNNCKHPVCKT